MAGNLIPRTASPGALGRAAKTYARRSLIRSGLTVIGQTPLHRLDIARGRAAIFTLHHVRPEEARAFHPNRHLEITPEFLDAALSEIGEAGYRFIPLVDLETQLMNDPDQRYAAITLDDGYRNNAEHAAPVFGRHAVPYTIFATRDFAEGTTPIWWELASDLIAQEPTALRLVHETLDETFDVATADAKDAAFDKISERIHAGEEHVFRDALAAAWQEREGRPATDLTRQLCLDTKALTEHHRSDPLCHLGAHTLSHPNLARLSANAMASEISGSMHWLRELTGEDNIPFAFPYGMPVACGDRESMAAEQAGAALAVTTQPGTLDMSTISQARFALPRISLNGFYQDRAAVRALLSGLPFAAGI